jgi:hypothetical protein
VLTEADGSAGRRLLRSPWDSWFGGAPEDWSAVYVSWLLRDSGVARTADVAALRDVFSERVVDDEPAPGALVFYARGKGVPPYHVGLVTSVTAGIAQTLEGDHPFTLPYAERFVRRFARPWSTQVTYAHPSYR